MRRHISILVLIALVPIAASAATAGLEITPTADLRVRQEVLDNVYHFTPDPDRNWIRVRSRLGLRVDNSAATLAFEARLNNEHRHYIDPDQDLDWDEVMVDRLFASWNANEDFNVTVGRQDIIWPGGFLVLEGHPLDGSRSIFHDGVRLCTHASIGYLDVAVVRNEKYNQLVLVDDEHRPLSDADELGLLLKLDRNEWSYSFIVKDSEDPDSSRHLRSSTAGVRYHGDIGGLGTAEAELAIQRQSGYLTAAIDGDISPDDGWALAWQAFLTRPIAAKVTAEVGAFYYSGLDGSQRPFRTPWGRWPKWSELYIYTLLGESTPGDPHVAAWENIAAPRLMLRRPLTSWLQGRAGVTWLLAPEPEWKSRGVLTQVELTAGLPHRLSAHVLWERLHPGEFHDGRYGLAAFEEPVNFWRWQLSWKL